jgi:hypothetical protein
MSYDFRESFAMSMASDFSPDQKHPRTHSGESRNG